MIPEDRIKRGSLVVGGKPKADLSSARPKKDSGNKSAIVLKPYSRGKAKIREY